MSHRSSKLHDQTSTLPTNHQEMDTSDLIAWTLHRFGRRAAICTSFQAEGMVVLDMAWRIYPDVRVFTIDTGRLPQETYDVIDRVREAYGVDVEIYYPDQHELSQLVGKHGVNLFYRSVSLRHLCCEVRKSGPLDRVLEDLDAWVTGLRSSQNQTRADLGKVELDRDHGNILKVNPVADWSHEQVWEYIRANNLPYNRLYDKGYTSIGCAPCTRPIRNGEDLRAGRWWWEDNVPKECGIHLSPAWRKAVRAGTSGTDKGAEASPDQRQKGNTPLTLIKDA